MQIKLNYNCNIGIPYFILYSVGLARYLRSKSFTFPSGYTIQQGKINK